MDDVQRRPPVPCDACDSVLRSNEDHAISFLLLDGLRIPLVSCEAHLDRFSTVCGLTSEGSVELLDHPPAGGISCPSCQFVPYSPTQAMIPVQDGAVAVLACPEHQAEIFNRFQTGLETHRRLTTDLDTVP